MKLSDIQIVLCNPGESRNVGAVCRVMKNMGLESLRIVGVREGFDDEKVRRLAVHAGDIWERAVFFPSLNAALTDCTFAAGTTRRRGKKRTGRAVTPEEFAGIAAAAGSGRGALVFGNERTGLTDDEMLCCTIPVYIPSDNAFPSLNLSHAVQVIAYILFRKLKRSENGYTPVTLERLDTAVHHIGSKLQEIGFFSVTGRPEMELFWREILSRSSLSEGELRYLETVFTKTAGLAGKNHGKGMPIN
ncbi:MAG: RNA methyltransferase [Spirochaetaceae bacterium]|jgi:tRNA/rRNA methyltransferase|nr:RNA methyltransferase [Spirochaetaceae bacterium]